MRADPAGAGPAFAVLGAALPASRRSDEVDLGYRLLLHPTMWT